MAHARAVLRLVPQVVGLRLLGAPQLFRGERQGWVGSEGWRAVGWHIYCRWGGGLSGIELSGLAELSLLGPWDGV